ncbi:MAG: DsbA family oxidoreductase [Cellulophaga sp.]|nr:DsbA family oxidoreductase [Cellulophaga sp.]
MNISIWSDIRCPFCYIGKRNFEKALADFPHKDKVVVEWKSFELDPRVKTRTDISGLAHFMEAKNVDKATAEGMFANVTQMAKTVGLDFQFSKMIPANSLKAHRLLHLAKKYTLADATKEALLKAHLVDGENIDDIDFLIKIATQVGLAPVEVKTILDSEDFTYEVRQDQMEAKNLGVNGVPFFIMDNTYGISGAQPVAVFTETLEKAWKKHQEQLTIITNTSGNACDVEGNCD